MSDDLKGLRVATYAEARDALRDLRERLCLTILEVEAAADLCQGHLAKIEPDHSQRIPNVETFIKWADALGFDLVLVRKPFPPRMVDVMCEARHHYDARERRLALKRQKAALPAP